MTRFPFLFGRAFIEARRVRGRRTQKIKFPFLFGRAFIEATYFDMLREKVSDFPSFSEGLSLRLRISRRARLCWLKFPFLFGRAFIEAGVIAGGARYATVNFPSFSEGLSLRPGNLRHDERVPHISLPFRKGFH